MYRYSILFFFIAVLWLPVANALTPFKADYNIAFGFVNLGEAKMQFQQVADNKYTLGFYAETSGFTAFVYPYSLQEKSTLERLKNGVLRSTDYFYEEKKEDDVIKQYKVSIDYTKKNINSIGLKKTQQWALPSNLATDKLSFAFIIGDDIEKGKKLRSPITIIDGSTIRVIPIKELTMPPSNSHQNENNSSSFQRNDYQKYRRFFLEDNGENIEIWLSKKQRHLPYKILFTSDGWTLHYELNAIHWLK